MSVKELQKKDKKIKFETEKEEGKIYIRNHDNGSGKDKRKTSPWVQLIVEILF